MVFYKFVIFSEFGCIISYVYVTGICSRVITDMIRHITVPWPIAIVGSTQTLENFRCYVRRRFTFPYAEARNHNYIWFNVKQRFVPLGSEEVIFRRLLIYGGPCWYIRTTTTPIFSVNTLFYNPLPCYNFDIPRFYSRNFKTLASFCGCTG